MGSKAESKKSAPKDQKDQKDQKATSGDNGDYRRPSMDSDISKTAYPSSGG